MNKKKFLWPLVPILISALLLLSAVFFLDRPDTHTVTITVPSSQQETYCFSDTVFKTTGNKIHILGGQDLGDSLVALKAVPVHRNDLYASTYITPGFEVTMDVEKGAVFQIGVLASNPTLTDREISLTISGIQILENGKS